MLLPEGCYTEWADQMSFDLEMGLLSPYLTGMRQPETRSRIVRDYYATKMNDINKTVMLQSH